MHAETGHLLQTHMLERRRRLSQATQRARHTRHQRAAAHCAHTTAGLPLDHDTLLQNVPACSQPAGAAGKFAAFELECACTNNAALQRSSIQPHRTARATWAGCPSCRRQAAHSAAVAARPTGRLVRRTRGSSAGEPLGRQHQAQDELAAGGSSGSSDGQHHDGAGRRHAGRRRARLPALVRPRRLCRRQLRGKGHMQGLAVRRSAMHVLL